MQSKAHILYKTTCLVTGKYYIGIHSTARLDDGYLGSGLVLRCSLEKHGREAHKREVLALAESRAELLQLEQEAVTLELLSDPLCMNLIPGGQPTFVYPESVDRRSDAHASLALLRQDPEWKKRDAERRQERAANNPSQWKTGLEFAWTAAQSPEAKAKRAETYSKIEYQQGKNNSQYGTMWVTKDSQNKKIHASELKDYIALGWSKGMFVSEATKQKRSKSNKESTKAIEHRRAYIGSKWYYNLELMTSKRFKLDEEVTEGWTRGKGKKEIAAKMATL